MDNDSLPDRYFMEIKEKLTQSQIKLWLPPFYTEGNNAQNIQELKKLAESFGEQLTIPVEVCLQYLKDFQDKALNNLRERDNFRNTGQASLKVRVPNDQGGNTLTVTIELNKSGIELKEEISRVISVPIERLKVIYKGQFLKDQLTLENQGIKHGLHMMAIVLNDKSDAEIPHFESNADLVASTREDIELVSKSQCLQVADQSGKLLKLPVEEKRSLVTAMTLHEKGRAAIKKEDYALALVLLLEAEKAFCQCNSSLLKIVDNYGVLSLDIVWCYLNLRSVTHLPDAEARLLQCEQSFQQSYGTNLERLTALKGFTGNELALLMRLHLLQAIVLYHRNRIEEAGGMLRRAEEELKILQVDDSKLVQLIEMGYGLTEARLALRASRGDVNQAVTIIENKRLEQEKNMELEDQERLNRKRKKLGKCLNDEWVDHKLHRNLVSMGFSYEISKWALAQTNNNINESINLINGHQGQEMQSARNVEIADDTLQKVVETGFDKEVTHHGLKRHKGDYSKAINELLNSGEPSSADTEGDEDDSSSDSDYDDDDDDDGPSCSLIKQKRREAYTRLKKDMSYTDDDHLDLNLVPETEFLKTYKELLSKR